MYNVYIELDGIDTVNKNIIVKNATDILSLSEVEGTYRVSKVEDD